MILSIFMFLVKRKVFRVLKFVNMELTMIMSIMTNFLIVVYQFLIFWVTFLDFRVLEFFNYKQFPKSSMGHLHFIAVFLEN